MKKCANHYAVAVDLGASGGKMAAASFDGSRIELADYITFPNQPVQILDTLYWDVFALYRSIVSGMTQYASELGPAATMAVSYTHLTALPASGRPRFPAEFPWNAVSFLMLQLLPLWSSKSFTNLYHMPPL